MRSDYLVSQQLVGATTCCVIQLCSVLVALIRIFNPTLSVPQTSQYHHISSPHVMLKITFHHDILIILIFIYPIYTQKDGLTFMYLSVTTTVD